MIQSLPDITTQISMWRDLICKAATEAASLEKHQIFSIHTDWPKRRFLDCEIFKRRKRYIFALLRWNKERQIWKAFNQSGRTRLWQKNHITAYISHRTRGAKERHKLKTKRSHAPSPRADEIWNLNLAAGAETRRDWGKGDVPLQSVILHPLAWSAGV